MRIADLADRHVAVWGFGREGRAALSALRQHHPEHLFTLFCGAREVAPARCFDAALDVIATAPDADALAAFDVVIKSPGISAYKPEILAAQARGTTFTSGTALWFAENPAARVIGVTGTKGKSTTSALIAHLARRLDVRTALAGNIGLPLLELRDAEADLWVVELSSFQTGEAGPLELGVITCLYEEHLDWHGSRERYVADKLKLADHSQSLLVNATQPALLERTSAHPHRFTFGDSAGWHVAEDAIRRGGQCVTPVRALSIPGEHNALNACAALAALELCGFDARAAAPALASFRALPHRLQTLGQRDDFLWVDDSISTTPQATLAALNSLSDREVTVLVGGFDRGLDWTDFATAMVARPPHAIVCNGANGARIAEALRAVGASCRVSTVDTLAAAVARARQVTPAAGCILLSPGAPSFDQFRDYVERGGHFAGEAGFDVGAVTAIDGLGVA